MNIQHWELSFISQRAMPRGGGATEKPETAKEATVKKVSLEYMVER